MVLEFVIVRVCPRDLDRALVVGGVEGGGVEVSLAVVGLLESALGGASSSEHHGSRGVGLDGFVQSAV